MRHARVWVCFGLVCALTGCSTVTHYTAKTKTGRERFERHDFKQAAREFESGTDSSLDGLCYRLEAGAARHSAGDYEKSNRHFEQAYREIKALDRRATVSARDAAAGAGTLILNEKTAPYRGEPFERVYVHTFAALNYLLMGNWRGARVEALRAFERQKYERYGFKKEYDRAVKQARSKKAYDSKALRRIQERYGTSVKASDVELFQDAFTYYLASVIYEIGGEYNNGLVEVRNLLAFRPASALARRQAARLVEKARKKGVFLTPPPGVGGLKVPLPGPKQGEVVVFFACGLSPIKQEVKITAPVPTQRGVATVTLAFPKYRRRPNPVAYGVATVGGRKLGRTETLSDVNLKALATLQRRLPTLVMKSLIRAVTRYAAQSAIVDSGPRRLSARERRRLTPEERRRRDAQRRQRQFMAGLVGALGRVVEQADLRSWLTLPGSFQAVRGVVPAGERTLTFALHRDTGSRAGQATQTVKVNPGAITVIVVRSVGAKAVVRWRAF